MEEVKKISLYEKLVSECDSITSSERNYIANTANIASNLYHELNAANEGMTSVNWFGFYFVDFDQKNISKQDLVLGPFHGKLACTRIKYGKGVCGECQSKQQTIIVKDVHEFPGHIACDSASNSEICVPLFNQKNEFIGMIDVDSPNKNQFDHIDKKYLEQIATILQKNCKWPIHFTSTPSMN